MPRPSDDDRRFYEIVVGVSQPPESLVGSPDRRHASPRTALLVALICPALSALAVLGIVWTLLALN